MDKDAKELFNGISEALHRHLETVFPEGSIDHIDYDVTVRGLHGTLRLENVAGRLTITRSNRRVP